MENKIVLCGFSQKEKEILETCVINKTGLRFIYYGSHCGAEHSLKEIVENELLEFSECNKQICNSKLVVFIDLENDVVKEFIKFYPKTLVRPMFCFKTSINYNWGIRYLKDHIIAEIEEIKKIQKGKI